MSQITGVRVANPKAKRLVGTAPSGEYLHSPGFPSQVIVLDLKFQPNQALRVGSFYAIAATGMPTMMNWQYDHSQTATDGTLYVFYEVLTATGGTPNTVKKM